MKAKFLITFLLATMMSSVLARETYIKVWCVNSKMFWDPTNFQYDDEKKMYEDTSKWAMDWRNDVSRIDRQFESFYPLTDSINRPIYFQESPEITKKYSKGESGRLYTLEFNLLDFKYFYHKYNKYTFDNGKSGACSIVEDPDHIVNLFHKYNNFQYLWYKDPKEKNKFYKGKVVPGHYEKYRPGESHDEDLKYVHEQWVTVFDEVGFKNWLTQATTENQTKIQELNILYEQWLDNERRHDQNKRDLDLKNNAHDKEVAELKKKIAALEAAAEARAKHFNADSYSPKQKHKQETEEYVETETPVKHKFSHHDWPEDETLASFVKRTGITKLNNLFGRWTK